MHREVQKEITNEKKNKTFKRISGKPHWTDRLTTIAMFTGGVFVLDGTCIGATDHIQSIIGGAVLLSAAAYRIICNPNEVKIDRFKSENNEIALMIPGYGPIFDNRKKKTRVQVYQDVDEARSELEKYVEQNNTNLKELKQRKRNALANYLSERKPIKEDLVILEPHKSIAGVRIPERHYKKITKDLAKDLEFTNLVRFYVDAKDEKEHYNYYTTTFDLSLKLLDEMVIPTFCPRNISRLVDYIESTELNSDLLGAKETSLFYTIQDIEVEDGTPYRGLNQAEIAEFERLYNRK